jgi:hypothetical protein
MQKSKPQPDEWEFEGKRYAGKPPGIVWHFNEERDCWEIMLIGLYRNPHGVINHDSMIC